MPWPFSRTEPASAAEASAVAAVRQGDVRDPAAELRAQTRRRLVGAAALLLAAVIVLPMLLDTTPRPVREDVAITVASPPSSVQTPADRLPPIDEKIAEPAPLRTESPPVEVPEKMAKPPTAPPPQPAPPAAQVAPANAAAPATEKFAVQVAALSTAAAAKELAARLKKGGFNAYIEAVSTADGTLHRVRVGPYAGREEAQRAVEKLKAGGHRAAVVGG
jgi:DedD protein